MPREHQLHPALLAMVSAARLHTPLRGPSTPLSPPTPLHLLLHLPLPLLSEPLLAEAVRRLNSGASFDRESGERVGGQRAAVRRNAGSSGSERRERRDESSYDELTLRCSPPPQPLPSPSSRSPNPLPSFSRSRRITSGSLTPLPSSSSFSITPPLSADLDRHTTNFSVRGSCEIGGEREH